MQTHNPYKKHLNHHPKPPKKPKRPKTPHKPRQAIQKGGQWGNTTHTKTTPKKPAYGQNTGANNSQPQHTHPNHPKSPTPAPILDIYSRIKEMDINHKHYFGELQAMCQNQMSDPKAMLGHIYQQAGEYCQALNDDLASILERLEPFCEMPFDEFYNGDDDFPFV